MLAFEMDQLPAHPATFFAQGRSYGDVALNDGGTLIKTGNLNRLISADWEKGIVRAESGLTLDALLRVCVPKGWFLPVTPGTKFVSLGGAVANDVHGKNHHISGSFGAHVKRLGLSRSDGEAFILSPRKNKDLFKLTISGLGLTGFIEWVELQLIPIKSASMTVENIPFNSLDEFFAHSDDSKNWPYTVAWVDCLASGQELGRGIFSRGRHSEVPGALAAHDASTKLTWPADAPNWFLNKVSISTFNRLYRARPGARFQGEQHYDPFFYPLDGIKNWNKMYGKQGFFQHQSIIPKDEAHNGVRALLEVIERSGQGSFLAVMKNHGRETSPGLNSFCLEGTSLALDFANHGAKTLSLLSELEAISLKHGGRLYPAKDGTMSAAGYQQGYPNWRALEDARDPILDSAFWQRVTGEAR